MTKVEEEVFERIMELPKITWAFFGMGFLTVIYSLFALNNIFFKFIGTFVSMVLFYWGYDYWYKKLNDQRVETLSKRLDSLIHPLKKEKK